METLIAASFKAVRSLLSATMAGVALFSILITIIALIAFVALCSGVASAVAHSFPGTFLGDWLPWFSGLASGMIAWFLFPGIMPVIVNFFDDRIARIIERRDYPEAQPPENLPFLRELFHDLRFTAFTLLLNLLALPLYLFLPGLNLLLFYSLNGYLLGREFFVMAARRYMPVEKAEILRIQKAGVVFAGGVLIAVGATVPLLNLLAPFWGIALMTHLFHLLFPSHSGTAPVEILPPASQAHG